MTMGLRAAETPLRRIADAVNADRRGADLTMVDGWMDGWKGVK
jgi:hypothetical protein